MHEYFFIYLEVYKCIKHIQRDGRDLYDKIWTKLGNLLLLAYIIAYPVTLKIIKICFKGIYISAWHIVELVIKKKSHNQLTWTRWMFLNSLN